MTDFCLDGLRGGFITMSDIPSCSTSNQVGIDISRQNPQFLKGSFFNSLVPKHVTNEMPHNIRMSLEGIPISLIDS